MCCILYKFVKVILIIMEDSLCIGFHLTFRYWFLFIALILLYHLIFLTKIL